MNREKECKGEGEGEAEGEEGEEGEEGVVEGGRRGEREWQREDGVGTDIADGDIERWREVENDGMKR